MKKNLNKIVAIAVATGLSAVGAFAAGSGTGNIAVPTPDYTDFYAIAGVAIGVGLVVMLAKRAKSFLR